jgi:hypothetical protein
LIVQDGDNVVELGHKAAGEVEQAKKGLKFFHVGWVWETHQVNDTDGQRNTHVVDSEQET